MVMSYTFDIFNQYVWIEALFTEIEHVCAILNIDVAISNTLVQD
jgi:hypothetical protein